MLRERLYSRVQLLRVNPEPNWVEHNYVLTSSLTRQILDLAKDLKEIAMFYTQIPRLQMT